MLQVVITVIRWRKRLIGAAAGAQLGAALVALVEAHACRVGRHGPRYLSWFLAELGLLSPFAIVLAATVGLLSIALEPDRPRVLEEHMAALRAQPVLIRSRTAAIAPLIVAVGSVWCVVMAHTARIAFERSGPLASGVILGVASVAVLFVLLAIALAMLPSLRRLLAASATRHPMWIDPVATGGLAFTVAVGCLIWGIYSGDTGGSSGGLLGIFGVLKRRELDLRPGVNLLVIAFSAYLAPIAFSQSSRHRGADLAIAIVALIPLGVTLGEAVALNAHPRIALAVERAAPLGKIALQWLRRATDRDHDGASALFGGGDCDDHDARRYPGAFDIPGNGIDEDCSGADSPLPEPPAPRPQTPEAHLIIPNLNLIFITVDTLRIDVGFMGYPKPVSPHLDALAERSVVFDRAYSMASYTGKSIGPMLIGKYPNETLRNGSHFNRYSSGNIFFAERVRDLGLATMAAASHWYFNPWSGLTQGFDVFDLSAKPRTQQGDTDTSITSPALTDAAIRWLEKRQPDDPRFFCWVHYFDPHAQYMPHEGTPDFQHGEKGGTAGSKAAYDGEVWFTDKHIGRLLDYVQTQPWSRRTAIVVTSDHGEAFAEHNMSWHGNELWEPLVRVPLVMYVPGLSPHRVAVKRSQIDLVPTLLELLGAPAPPPGELSGVSFLSDLVVTDRALHEERDVYLDLPVGPYNAMRRGLIHGPTPGMKLIYFGGRQYQLFDLASDPREQEDLADETDKFDPMVDAFQSFRRRLHEIDVKPEVAEDTP